MVIQPLFGNARSRITRALILILFNGLAAQAASAASQEGDTKRSMFGSKYVFALGGYFPYTQSKLTLTGPGGQGDSLDSDDLGLDDFTSSLWGSFNWRFLPRHQLHLEYFTLDRDGSRSAGRSFNIGGTDVGVGASLDTTMDLGLGRVTYGYSIIQKSNWDLAFNVGFHVVTAKASVTAAGNVSVNGMPVLSGSVTESSSTLTFPLPHIGGSVAYKFGPKITGVLTGLIFTIDLGEYAGTLIEVDAMVSYQITKHFGIGGGAKYFDLNLQDNLSGGGSAEFDFSFIGPAFFVYGNF